MMKPFFYLAIVAGLLLNFIPGFAQDKDSRFYETKANEAYKEKNFKAFLENISRAGELRPNHPRLIYNLAAAFSLDDQPEKAVAGLNRLAEMGLIFSPEKDEDFAAVKDSAEFKNILKKFEQNRKPLIKSSNALTVRQKGLVPESIAYDPKAKTFYLSSVFRRKIVRINPDGTVTDFAGEQNGLWSVMGIRIDAKRRHLWAATVAHPQMENFKKADEGLSGLFKFDLQTGKLLNKYILSNKEEKHWLGDLVINSKGDVFASDSISPAIYVLRHDQKNLEPFLKNDAFMSPQGLAFDTNEKRLFLADYGKGIFLIDLQTKKVSNLQPQFNSTLLGIDGLYFYKNSLIAVQNGVRPNRIIRFFLDKNSDKIEKSETVEANNPVFDEPTLGLIENKNFYFVANSQWNAIDEQGNLAAEDKLKEPVILKIKL